MPVSGDLGTMPLPDLLQWIGESRKTGVLELQRNGHVRQVEFRQGFIGSCATDDPGLRFDAFLLSRNKVTPEQLDEAFRRHTEGGQRFGWILVEMGVLSRSEIVRLISAHVEKCVQNLFDWRDAAFHFHQGATFDPHQIEVNLAVSDVILRGSYNRGELNRLREAFGSSGVVLRRTEVPPPDEVLRHRASRHVLESVDGRRSLAEIVTDIGAPEIPVLKLLFRLQQMGVLEVVEIQPRDPARATLLDPDQPDPGPDRAPGSGTSGGALRESGDAEVETEAARRLIRRGEHEAAIALLCATRRAHPSSAEVQRLLDAADRNRAAQGLSGERKPRGFRP